MWSWYVKKKTPTNGTISRIYSASQQHNLHGWIVGWIDTFHGPLVLMENWFSIRLIYCSGSQHMVRGRGVFSFTKREQVQPFAELRVVSDFFTFLKAEFLPNLLSSYAPQQTHWTFFTGQCVFWDLHILHLLSPSSGCSQLCSHPTNINLEGKSGIGFQLFPWC